MEEEKLEKEKMKEDREDKRKDWDHEDSVFFPHPHGMHLSYLTKEETLELPPPRMFTVDFY